MTTVERKPRRNHKNIKKEDFNEQSIVVLNKSKINISTSNDVVLDIDSKLNQFIIPFSDGTNTIDSDVIEQYYNFCITNLIRSDNVNYGSDEYYNFKKNLLKTIYSYMLEKKLKVIGNGKFAKSQFSTRFSYYTIW